MGTYTEELQKTRAASIAPYVKSLSFDGQDIIVEYRKDVIRDDNDLGTEADAWTKNYKRLINEAGNVVKLLSAYGLEAKIGVHNDGFTRVELFCRSRLNRTDKPIRSDDQINTALEQINLSISPCLQLSGLDFNR